jgi:ABC-2 type transport system ATP-binding protein
MTLALSPAMLACRAVRLQYADGTVALEDVTLTLDDGIVGLVGANGAGKTSLLRLIGGVIAPSAGEVEIGGRRAPAHRVARGIGSIPEAARLPAYLTVAAFLDGLRRAAGDPTPTAPERQVADALGVEELAGRNLAALSLGQRRRVELVAALIGDPDVLLLDEPTNGLDPLAMAALRRGLLDARRPGRLIVVSSHHLDELQRIADWLVLLHAGRVVASEAAGTLLARGDSLEDVFLSVAGAARG